MAILSRDTLGSSSQTLLLLESQAVYKFGSDSSCQTYRVQTYKYIDSENRQILIKVFDDLKLDGLMVQTTEYHMDDVSLFNGGAGARVREYVRLVTPPRPHRPASTLIIHSHTQ